MAKHSKTARRGRRGQKRSQKRSQKRARPLMNNNIKNTKLFILLRIKGI